MLNFNINLTSLAVILWSGMLIIAGSIWVLSSQVRKLADILEEQAQRANLAENRPSASIRQTRPSSPSVPGRRRVTSRVVRGSLARSRIAYVALTSTASNTDEEEILVS
jgi:hypothetical protein